MCILFTECEGWTRLTSSDSSSTKTLLDQIRRIYFLSFGLLPTFREFRRLAVLQSIQAIPALMLQCCDWLIVLGRHVLLQYFQLYQGPIFPSPACFRAKKAEHSID